MSKLTRLMVTLVAGITMVLTLGVLPVPVALADTITVSSCDASDLVAAIDTANGNGEDDTIVLQAGCTYTLSSANVPDPDGYGPIGLPPITSNIIIQGNGAIITRSSSDPFRIFYVSDTGNLALENLTLSNGLAQGGNGGNAQYDGAGGGAGMGGAIFNQGTLTVSGVTLTGNTAQGGDGGDDYSGSSAAAGGGGMGGDGQNGPGGNNGGDGGGVNGGTGGTTPSTPQGGPGGIGGGGGGAAYTGAYGPGGNGGFGGGGGGGGWNGTSGGHGGFGGGGGGTQGTPYAPGGFGGGSGGLWAGGGGGGLGGAVFNDAGTLIIDNSTLTGNAAQGGDWGYSGRNATGGSGYGGAIFNYNGTITVVNATIANNTVAAGTGGSGADGGGTYNYQDTGTASLTIKNTILSDTPAGNTDCYNNSGTVTAPASNRNLIENNAGDVNACGIPYSSSDPQLGVLADNGGDTWTHALQEGSPAIDAGTAGGAPATDQRGVARPQGVAFDIGSYEKAQVMLSLVKTVDDETPDPGQLVTYTISVDNNGALTATNALISDTLPGGLTFVGPIILDPSSAGTTGTEPTLAYGLTITGEERVTVTFPVMVNTGLAGDTVIINTASITSDEVVTPQTGLVALTVNNVAPVAMDDSYSVNEGATLNATAATGVLSNDPPDLNGDTLTVTLDGNVSHGTLTLNADGSFTYRHNGGETTSDSFTYHVTDGIDDSNVATVNITINPVNDRPNIVDDGAVTDRIAPTTVDVLANDSDADGNLVPSSVTVTRDSSYGSTTVNPTTGEITYTPAGDWSGNDNFEYQVCDDGTPLPAQCSSAKVHISQLNWSENFDSYTNGSELHDLGAWEGWIDNPTYDAPVTDSESRSAPHSVDIHGSADLVQRFYGYTYGRWTFTAWQYIPDDFSGTSYFIMQNRYPNNLNWSMQVLFNSSNGRLHSDNDGSELDLITGQWVELRVEIDLDNDWQRFFYDDQLLYEKSWSAGVSGGGSLNIGALDLYANNASPIYYDDLSLSPAPIWDGGGVDNNWSTPRNWLGNVVPNASDVVFFNDTSDKDASIDGPVSVAGMVIETGYDGAITQGSDALTITGVFTQAGGTFNGGSSPVDITLNGNLVKSGGVFNANSSTIIFDGAGTQFLNTDAITLADVTVSNGVTLTTEADVTLTGMLTNNGATQETQDVAGAGTISFGLADISVDVTTQGSLSSLQVVRIDQNHPNAPSGLQTGKRWALTPTGSGYAVNLTLPKSSPPDAYDLVCRYTGSGQVWDCSADGFDAVNNTITRNGITQLSDWTLGRNEPPTAVDDDATVDEGGTVNTPNVLDNDSDPEGYGLTVNTTPASGPSYGALTLNANGTFSYTHDGSENHNDNFVYEVCDDFTPSQYAQATVNIAVNPVNDAPVAVDDVATTDEDTVLTVPADGVLSNDTDVDASDTLTVTAYDAASVNGASVTVNADGSYTYDPTGSATLQALAVGETLVDTFDYTIGDGHGGSDTATVRITVTGVNDGPTANDDTGATDEDTVLTVPADGVLSNDTDVDVSDTLTVTAFDATSAAGASVMVNADGSYTYDPTGSATLQALAVAETLVDTFGYTIGDGHGGSDTATVSITVTGVNDAPTAVDDVATTDEDSSVVIDVLGNDTDVDASDSHTVDSVDTTGTQGTATNNGADVTYDPGAAFQYLAVGESATDVFAYTVSDGNGGTDTAVVTVTVTGVNDAPVAVDDVATTDEDSSVAIDVLSNDTDVDTSDSHTVDSVDTTGTQGTVTNNGSDVTYDPGVAFQYLAVGESATDMFAYTVSDGNGGTDTAVVTVTVTGINDDPVANDDTATTDEDTAVNIDVLGNDTDVEGDSLTVDSVTPPANGMVSNYGSYVVYTPDDDFNGTDTFNYTARDGNGGFDTATVTVTVNPTNDAPVANNDADSTDEDTAVTIDVLDNDTDVDGDSLFVDSVTQPANGTVVNNDSDVTYTPDADFNGTDTFVYGVSDGNGGSDIAMVIVTVNSVNDDPVANDDTTITNEDTAVTIDVLDNDTDVDGDTLTVDAIGTPTTGTVTINLDYTVIYTPNVDFNGTDSFTYTIGDGNGGFATATVSVRVGPVNDAPVANDDAATTDEDTAITIDVLANDTDLDDDPLTVDAVGAPANGTVANNGSDVTYTPNADFNGTDVFTYTASDGYGGTDTATVTVTVNPVNDAPIANDDTDTTDEDTAVTIDVLGNDSDVEGDSLSVDSVGASANGTVVNNSSDVTYTPDADFNGTDVFTYTVSDGNGGTDTATVIVTVNPVNDAPVVNDDTASTDEDTGITIDVLDNDTDLDGDSLTVDTVGAPANGATVNNGDDVTYTPNADFNGTDVFTYTASDGYGGADTATVTVTVNPVNDAPVANDDTDTTDEDTAVTIDVLGNDSDVEGDSLSVDSVGASANGTVVNNSSDVTYTPDADLNGTDAFTYTVSDGNGGTDTATVIVTVNPINDAPIASDDSYSVDEGGTLDEVAPGVLGNDTDTEGDLLTATLVSGVTNGTLTLNADGSFTYEHDGSETTSDSFTYHANDGNDDSNVATVDITIAPSNDAPVASDDTANTPEDTPVTIDVLSNDTDADNDPLTVIAVGVPSNGSAHTDTATVTYTPTLNFNGLDTFTYTISDGNGGSDTATVYVTVSALNDAPTVSDVNKTGDENTTITFTLSDFADQFTDVDGDSLVQIKIAALPSHGTLYLSASPVMVDQEIAAGELNNLTYEPDTNYIGPDNFSWNGSDGAIYAVSDALVNLTIGDAPSSISVTKSASPASLPEPGGEVTFTVRVENTSVIDSVTIDSLVDDIYGDLNGQGNCVVPQTIAAGDFYECAFNATIGGNAGYSETDTVTASGSDDDGLPVSASDSAEVRIEDVLPGILVTKTASPAVVRSGDSVDFGIQVYNTSVESVTLTSLDDTAFGDLTGECGLPVDIDVGGSFECVVNRAINADHTNTVTATAEDDEGNQTTDSADASVDVIGPAIQVIKEASVETARVGETITYTYAVENTGDVTLTDVIASDDRLGSIDLDSATLEPGQVATGVATHTVTGSDLPGPIVNTVMVTGTPPAGDTVIDTDVATVYLIELAPPDNKIYLPLILNISPPSSPAPDLVVESITVTSDNAQVVIRNQGDAPVTSDETFWVDLYVNPNPPPTGVNQTWQDRCTQGIVWGVTPPLLPINPGDTITLFLGDVYYRPEYSHFPGSLPAGTPIYVQVDSANATTNYGGVLESHEITGEPYNNISGPMLSTSGAMSDGPMTPPSTGERPSASSYHLPPR